MADNKLCPTCGANPCYRICPTQDPYQGDQQRENEDYEFNARFDDKHERFAGEIDGLPDYHSDEHDDEHGDESPEGFRPNDDGTVTYISPTGGEHTYDPDQAFPAERADDGSIPF